MILACELAGFFAAHCLWSLSDEDTFTPVLAYTTGEGKREMERFVGDDTAAIVRDARKKLDDNPMDADDAVLLYDARINTEAGKLDAIVSELRAWFSPSSVFCPETFSKLHGN